MKKLVLLLTILFPVLLNAQKHQVLDGTTNQGIPFVRVEPNPGNAFTTDIDGYFEVPADATALRLEYAGFQDTVYPVENLPAQLLIFPTGRNLDEFVLKPGVNPAERIVSNAIENRKNNHPMGKESWKYDSYSKFVFTMNQDALANISDTVKDSSLIGLKAFFGQQHIFMMESTSTKYFEPPFREKEVITAYKVSGFTDPAFSTFANEMQSFNFYENQFNLLGKSYVNPIALGGIRRYLFILEDTTYHGKDTTYTIRFQPRKDKNFDGMKGYMYINTNGWALEKVIAEPAEQNSSIHPKIIQEYRLVDGKKWFPYKLSTEATIPALRLNTKLKDSYVVGKGSTYIDHIELGADNSKQRFNGIETETTEDAGEKDSTQWTAARKYGLTKQEQRTYVMVDSLSKAEHFDRKLEIFRALANGKIPLGYLQLDLKRLIDYRDYEGYRFGAGLETSSKLWKRAMVGGYFGYGTRDKTWKYGEYGNVLLVKRFFITLEGKYQQDLIERGGVQFEAQDPRFTLDAISQHFYVNQMERQRIGELALSGYIFPRLKVRIAGNYQRIQLTKGYEFMSPTYFQAGSYTGLATLTGERPFEVAEFTAEAVWSIREKLKYFGSRRVSLGSKWPRVTAKYAQGVSGIGNALLNYQRLNVTVDQTIEFRAAGKFSWLASFGQTFGDAPMYLNQVARGTGGYWNMSVMNSFETMHANVFYQTKQAALFTRYFFKPLKLKVRWTAPQFFLHHALGIGELDNRNLHVLNGVQDMSKGYYEAGIGVNSLLKSNITGIGIGAFYNYGPYADVHADQNLVVKLTVSIAL